MKGFTDYASGIWFPNCSKFVKKCENNNDVITFCNDITVNCLCYFISLVKFSYWSQFHVNINTGSTVMPTFFCKGLTRNLEIEKIPN